MFRPTTSRPVRSAPSSMALASFLAVLLPASALAARGRIASHLVDAPGYAANDASQVQSSRRLMSADGRFVVFASKATNLVTGQVDTNGTWDVFLYDRESGLVRLVSHTPGNPGVAGNGESTPRAVSADGRFVAFSSLASTLTGQGDTNSTWDAFLWDREADTTWSMSRNALDPMQAGNGASHPSRLSADGEWLLLRSTASNLAPGGTTDGNGAEDVFLWRRSTNDMALVSHIPSDEPGIYQSGNAASSPQTMTPDGRAIVYLSNATDLVAAGSDGNGGTDVFLFDRATGVSTLVSHRWNAFTTTASGISSAAFSLSADGRYLAFQTTAIDVIWGVSNGPTTDVYLWDRDAGTNTLVSRGYADPLAEANASSEIQGISADGRQVVFSSKATDLSSTFVDGNGAAAADAWSWDRTTGAVTLLSHTAASTTTGGNGESIPRTLSTSGRIVAFDSLATDLVAGQVDTNAARDAFVWDRASGSNRLVSTAGSSSVTSGGDESTVWGMSASGAFLALESLANDTIPDALDENGVRDVLHVLDPFPLLHEDDFEMGSFTAWSRVRSE